MTKFAANKNLHAFIFVFTLMCFLGLSIASIATYRPEVDEGMFASPAKNLAEEGYLGTTILDTSGTKLTRIEQRTYWVMPLFLLNVAAFFKVIGVSLFSMRLVSAFWGVILLISWYLILIKLAKNRAIALLGMALIACSYMVIVTASMARMDIMSASLGYAGIALFLVLREKNLNIAILLSQTAIMLSGLTHSNGLMAFIGLAFLVVYLDFKKIRPKHILFAAVPYLVGGGVFSAWILQDVGAFRDQFLDNAKMSGRMDGFTSPLNGFIREFTERYPSAFGLNANTGGHSGPIYLKSLILIGYIVGVLGLAFTKSLRQNRNYFCLLILVAIYFAAFSILDGQKQTYYLVHIIPLYVACLAIWINWAWGKSSKPIWRLSLAGGVLIFVALQVGGIALRTKQNTYGKLYLPAIDYLKENAAENDLIFGKSDLAFGLNFPDNFVDDGEFGYSSGKKPKFIIYDSQVENSLNDAKVYFPEFYEYLPNLLENQYELAFENDGYKIYRRLE
jgi:4-amino-4-deoxy-L-arabinose transferase-like glycosyltransferase